MRQGNAPFSWLFGNWLFTVPVLYTEVLTNYSLGLVRQGSEVNERFRP